MLGAGAWLGGIAATVLPVWASLALVGTVLLGAVVSRQAAAVGAAVAAAAVAGVALLHAGGITGGPVHDLASERAVVTAEVTVTSDPRVSRGRFGDVVVVRGDVRTVEGRGTAYDVRSPVVLLADEEWRDVALGERVRVSGRLGPADDGVAALMSVRGRPEVVAGPDPWWRAAAAVRHSIRESVAPRAEHPRELVPALVVGDDSGLDPALADDFRTTGLTHLLAVSGTNLTLLVGFMLVVARWLRGAWPLDVRRRRGRHRRLRAHRAHRAERRARRGDGHRGTGGDGHQRTRARLAVPRRGRPGPAARGPRPGGVRRASHSRCWRPAASCSWRPRGATP